MEFGKQIVRMTGSLKEMLAPKTLSGGSVTYTLSQMRSLSMYYRYDPEVVLRSRFDSVREANRVWHPDEGCRLYSLLLI